MSKSQFVKAESLSPIITLIFRFFFPDVGVNYKLNFSGRFLSCKRRKRLGLIGLISVSNPPNYESFKRLHTTVSDVGSQIQRLINQLSANLLRFLQLNKRPKKFGLPLTPSASGKKTKNQGDDGRKIFCLQKPVFRR